MRYKAVQPPQGLMKSFFRLPILLYRLGLGGLPGKRFILLNHQGRKSGITRQVVLKVIGYDRYSGSVHVVAAYGDRADWVRNVRRQPAVQAQLAWKKYPAEVVFVDEPERISVFLAYARRYPKLAVRMPGMVGYELDGSEDDFAAFAREAVIARIDPVAG